MRILLQKLLAKLAKQIVQKHKPIVIGITGSVGKTSTKDAVFNVVSQAYNARKTEKNFNNELGMPLTIVGAPAPGRNPWKWFVVFAKAIKEACISKEYPGVLVLEMGVDKPGDMDYLISIAQPHIAVITAIGVAHYEFFKDAEAIEKEKGKIVEGLKEKDFFVVNAHDPVALDQIEKTSAKVLSYGQTAGDVHLTNIQEQTASLPFMSSFTVHTPKTEFKASMFAVGESHLQSVSAAAAVGYALGIKPEAIAKGVSLYTPTPGRLNAIAGIKRSVILDDTYNASPHAMVPAINLLKKTLAEYRIAVLGDMLELGDISQNEHEAIGKLIAHATIDELVTVGMQGKIIAKAALSEGMNPQKVRSFNNADEAKKYVQDSMRPQSAVLVKGSQGMRMEKITLEIMAEPQRAAELLCRQYGGWVKS